MQDIAPRLRHLRVGDCEGAYNPQNLFHLPAPQIRSLVYFDLASQNDESSPLLGWETPKLRRLTLVGFGLWPSKIMRNLTCLCLSNRSRSLDVSVQALVDVLRDCPDLEELRLINAGPDGRAQPERHSVHLARLQRFCLDAVSTDTIYFALSCITFGLPTCVIISNSTVLPFDDTNMNTIVQGFLDRFKFLRAFLSTNPNNYDRRLTLASVDSTVAFQWSSYEKGNRSLCDIFDLASRLSIHEVHVEVGIFSRDPSPFHLIMEAISRFELLSTISLVLRGDMDDIASFSRTLCRPTLAHVAINFSSGGIQTCSKWQSLLKSVLVDREASGVPLQHLALRDKFGTITSLSFLHSVSHTLVFNESTLWEMQMPSVVSRTRGVHPSWRDYRLYAVLGPEAWMTF